MPITIGQNGSPDDFINSSEKDATPSNDNGRVPKLETVDSEDAKVHRAFLPKFLQRVFTSSGTFTIPSGVYRVRIRLWGAGGGGEGANDTDGGDQTPRGGYGGQFREAVYDVTPGDQLTVTIGTGGGGVSGASGSSGGDSTVAHSTTPSKLSMTARGGGGGGTGSPHADAGSATGSDLVANTTYVLSGSGDNAGSINASGGGGIGGFGGPKGGASADANNSGSTSGSTGENGLAVIELY